MEFQFNSAGYRMEFYWIPFGVATVSLQQDSVGYLMEFQLNSAGYRMEFYWIPFGVAGLINWCIH